MNIAQAADKNTKNTHIYKNWAVAFFLSMVSEVTVWKKKKKTLLCDAKVVVQKLVVRFWSFMSNHKVNKKLVVT